MTPELSREQIEHIAETLRSFATAYPESIFTPFTPEETEEHSLIITRASGAMGRHCAQFMTEGANAIEQTLKAESSHAKSIEQINREAFRFVDLSPDEQSNRNGEYVPAELARKLQAELEAMTLERDGVVKYSGEYIASTDRHVAHLISKLDAAESQLTALTAGLLSERAKPSSLGQPVRRDTRTTYSSGRTTVSVEHFKADGTSEGSWGIDPQPRNYLVDIPIHYP